jgi:hypothetical protein
MHGEISFCFSGEPHMAQTDIMSLQKAGRTFKPSAACCEIHHRPSISKTVESSSCATERAVMETWQPNTVA